MRELDLLMAGCFAGSFTRVADLADPQDAAAADTAYLNTWYLYLGTLVIVVPVILWRREFPGVGASPPGCPDMVVDFLDGYGNGRFGDYAQCPWDAGGNCSAQSFGAGSDRGSCAARPARTTTHSLVLGEVMIVGNLVLAILYTLEEFGSWDLLFGVIQYFTTSGIVPLEGLMLVAVGILFRGNKACWRY